jgi:hypothetical protein
MGEGIDYTQYFRVGMRIGIDIPLASGQIFREWGLIISLEDDYLQIRLSRDVLPEEMRIQVGTIFLLVTGKEGSGLCCRGIVVAESSRRVVPLQLISEVLPYERRDYFRLATYLPMAFEFCRGLTGREIRERWEETRLLRAYQWGELNEAVPMSRPLTPDQRSRYEELRDSLKVRFQPMAANLSGGGIRLKVPQCPSVGDRVAMQFFIPFAKPNTVDLVGEVVWTTPVLTSSSTEPLHYVAMSYYHLDERDRESIIRFISLEQLQQLQQHKDKSKEELHPDEDVFVSPSLAPRFTLRGILITLAVCIVLAAVAAWLTPILIDYYTHKSGRNPIEDNFNLFLRQSPGGRGGN